MCLLAWLFRGKSLDTDFRSGDSMIFKVPSNLKPFCVLSLVAREAQ